MDIQKKMSSSNYNCYYSFFICIPSIDFYNLSDLISSSRIILRIILIQVTFFMSNLRRNILNAFSLNNFIKIFCSQFDLLWTRRGELAFLLILCFFCSCIPDFFTLWILHIIRYIDSPWLFYISAELRSSEERHL